MPKNHTNRIITFIWISNFLLICYLIFRHFYWFPLQSINSTKLTQKERLELNNPVRTTFVQAMGVLIQSIGGAAVLITFYFTQKNLKIAQDNLKATQDRQITERFTKAIEQLGSQELSLCLGGIYALERIAQESERDRWPIMEVLAAYVCAKAKSSNNRNDIPAIQAILDIFNRYNQTYRKDERRYLNLKKVNFSQSLFPELDFYGLNLSNADFKEANLSERQFILTNFDSANLSGANLKNAEFRNVNFQNANFSNANLVGIVFGVLYNDIKNSQVYFSGANFSDAKFADVDPYTRKICLTTQIDGADFKNTVLVRTDFRRVNLTGADFRGAKLERTNFTDAILNDANFQNVIFAGSYLLNASLSHANLSGTNLRGANFRDADLENVNFSEADLANADFRGAKNLTVQQIKAAKSWKDATYDESFKF